MDPKDIPSQVDGQTQGTQGHQSTVPTSTTTPDKDNDELNKPPLQQRWSKGVLTRTGSTQSSVSVISSNNDICRICHCEGDDELPLVTPCLCLGSLQHVHQACLQQWIKSSNTKSCEMCRFPFVMQTKLKPIGKVNNINTTGPLFSPVFRLKTEMIFDNISYAIHMKK